jgi:hypothetical protein
MRLCRFGTYVLFGFVVLAGGFLAAEEPPPAPEPVGGASESLFTVEAPQLRLSAVPADPAVGGLVSALDPSLALGQTEGTLERSIGFKAGIGFSSDPTTFLMTYQADFFLHPSIALGPLFQFGVSDDDFFFAPTLNAQALFDLPVEGLEALKPCFQFGLGLLYLDKDRWWGDKDDVGFLINLGLGLEYFLTDYFALGTNFLFNVMPADVLGDNFIFGWQVITLRFQF